MSFIFKTFLYIVVYIALFVASYFDLKLAEITCKLRYFDIHITGTVFLMALVSSLFISHLIKSFIRLIKSFIDKNKHREELESVKLLINLALSDTSNIRDNISKQNKISDKFKYLKDAIICGILGKKYGSEVLGSIDELMEIVKINPVLFAVKANMFINGYIKTKYFEKAVEIINLVIKNTPEYTYIIKDRILEIVPICLKNGINFSFEPKKGKHNIDKEFLEKFYESFILSEHEIEPDEEAKLLILEKGNKKFSGSMKITKLLIDSYFSLNRVNEKKIIDIIKKCFEVSHDKTLAYYLLKLPSRQTLFESAQEIVSSVSDDILDKKWFLCIVATDLGFFSKSVSLLRDIVDNDDSVCEVLKFYIKNYSNFSRDTDILQILKQKIEEGAK